MRIFRVKIGLYVQRKVGYTRRVKQQQQLQELIDEQELTVLESTTASANQQGQVRDLRARQWSQI